MFRNFNSGASSNKKNMNNHQNPTGNHHHLELRLHYQAPIGPTLPSGYGICPSGDLTTTIERSDSPWIELHYVIPSGTQAAYHPHPGVPHGSVNRIAYLPNTPEGLYRVLPRFHYAFLHGHSLTVGYSQTFKKDDQVTWSELFPHKTNQTSGGLYGFPDPNYLGVLNAALTRLDVPATPYSCQRWIQQHTHNQSSPLPVVPGVVPMSVPTALTNVPRTVTPPRNLPVLPQQQQPQQPSPVGVGTVVDDRLFSVQDGLVTHYQAPSQWYPTDLVQYLEPLSPEDYCLKPASRIMRSASAPHEDLVRAVTGLVGINGAAAATVTAAQTLAASAPPAVGCSPSGLAAGAGATIHQGAATAIQHEAGGGLIHLSPSSSAGIPSPGLQPVCIVTAQDVMLQQIGSNHRGMDLNNRTDGGLDGPYNTELVGPAKRRSGHYAEEENKDDRCSVGNKYCSICMDCIVCDGPNCDAVRLKRCRHVFHRSCIVSMVQSGHSQCPSCRIPISPSACYGKGPSGTMKAHVDRQRRCDGYRNDDGAIVIYYDIPHGIQTPYMESPGIRYTGTYRVAYLPNNDVGRKLLVRLRYAFQRGLTFRVGTSLTTGMTNQVTWTSIHHKTNLHGGQHGFPDPNYIDSCNAALDALYVPFAGECL